MGKPNKDSRETRSVTTELKYALKIIKSKTDAVYIFAFVASVFSRFFDSLSQNRFRKRCHKKQQTENEILKKIPFINTVVSKYQVILYCVAA